MNRPEVYSGVIPRSYDFLKGWRDAQSATGIAISDVLGSQFSLAGTAAFGANSLLQLDSTGVRTGITTGLTGGATYNLGALVSGGPITGTGVNFNINIGPVDVYCFSGADNVGNILNNGGTPTGYGDIAASTTEICHQCLIAGVTQLQVASAAPGSGYDWYLITVTPTQLDTTDADDPNIGATSPNQTVFPYYNSANPQTPLAGPGGTNPPTQQPSDRATGGTFNVIGPTNGGSATVPPSGVAVPSTDVGLYLIRVASTDTHIVGTQVFAIGLGTAPALTSGYVAPFIRGLTEQHHLGVPGGAPQIDGAVEWKPLATVPNNGQKISGLAPHFITPAGGSFPTTDYATVNSQLILNPTPTASSFGGSESSSGSISAVSISTPLYSNWNPVPGGPIIHIYTGTLNFTTSSAAAGDHITYLGNAHAGTAFTGNVAQFATNNDPGGGIGLFSANPTVGNVLIEFDFTFTLADSLTNGSYSVPFSLMFIGY